MLKVSFIFIFQNLLLRNIQLFLWFKSINQIDKYCIFFYSKNKSNQYSFSIGSERLISLSFNKFGHLINSRRKRKFHSCPESTNTFNIVTKSTDNIYKKKKDNPLIIVYEPKKSIKSYSLKNGYQNIFYSSLNINKIGNESTMASAPNRQNYTNKIQRYKPYQVI